MPLEDGTTIADLNENWPLGSDPVSAGDDHLRLIKKVLKLQWPNLDCPVTATCEQLNAAGSFNINRIINGNSVVNQRGFDGVSWVDGEYGYDRWKGHADGKEQIIEKEFLELIEYTLSWQGGGNGTFNGVTGASPITSTLTDLANDISVVVPAAATEVQLQEGGTASGFVTLPYSDEYTRCLRYYERRVCSNSAQSLGTGFVDETNQVYIQFDFAEKRIAPTFSYGPNVGSFEGVDASATSTTTGGIAALNYGTVSGHTNFITSPANLVKGRGCSLRSTEVGAWVAFDAEL